MKSIIVWVCVNLRVINQYKVLQYLQIIREKYIKLIKMINSF